MDGCCGRAQLLLKMNLLIFQRKILSDIVVGLPAIRVKNFDVKLHNNIAISAKRTRIFVRYHNHNFFLFIKNLLRDFRSTQIIQWRLVV